MHLQRFAQYLDTKKQKGGDGTHIIERNPVGNPRRDGVKDLSNQDRQDGHDGEGGDTADKGNPATRLHGQQSGNKKRLVAEFTQKH